MVEPILLKFLVWKENKKIISKIVNLKKKKNNNNNNNNNKIKINK